VSRAKVALKGAGVKEDGFALHGMDVGTPDPPDGRIERTASGEPQGTLHEGAMSLVQRVVPAVTRDEQVAGILEGQRYLHSLGITAWQGAIVGDYPVVPDCFEAYREADGRGLLTARVAGGLWGPRAAGGGSVGPGRHSSISWPNDGPSLAAPGSAPPA